MKFNLINNILIKKHNKALCKKYPFLKKYIYSSKKVNYQTTWEDDLPLGWRTAFCPQIWDELKAILEKANYVNEFRFIQIKEKWGELRMYYSGIPSEIADEVYAWEEKYSQLSTEKCIGCGQTVKYMTLGWISYVCEECAQNFGVVCIDVNDIEAYYHTPREERNKLVKNFRKNNLTSLL